MADNQRESFRIDADPELQAELFHEGRVAPCRLLNLSAGGALVECALDLPPGTQCTLGVRLRGKLAGAGLPYVSFLMEALEATEGQAPSTHRLRSMTGPGSQQYEDASKLVFEAQRLRRAAESGSAQASPMASDPDRRRQLRPQARPRFSKGSLRPDQPD